MSNEKWTAFDIFTFCLILVTVLYFGVKLVQRFV